MPLKISIRNNTTLARARRELRRDINNALREQLPTIKDEIVSRTKAGQSIEGGAFARYSAAYAAATGKRTPDLTLTGQMLGSIKTRVTTAGEEAEGIIEVTGGFNRDKAVWNQGGNPNIPARPFMGLSKQQISVLIRKIRDAIIK